LKIKKGGNAVERIYIDFLQWDSTWWVKHYNIKAISTSDNVGTEINNTMIMP
jgi:hypothetical protein